MSHGEPIERYDWSEYDGMVPCSDGDYVGYEDHAAALRELQAERDAALVALESAQNVRDEAMLRAGEVMVEGDALQAEVDLLRRNWMRRESRRRIDRT